MRYSASDKTEIIRLVEQSPLRASDDWTYHKKTQLSRYVKAHSSGERS